MKRDFSNLTISNHPLILDKLSKLRDKTTPHFQFNTLLDEISLLLFYEASGRMETVSREIDTPLEKMTTRRLKREVLLVPILRAGLGMVSGIMHIYREARVGMIGMYRDEETLQPIDYYLNLPPNLPEMEVFLVDPMLATGGSATAAVRTLKEKGARRMTMLAIICAPEGVENLSSHYPEVQIYGAALDRQLNENGFILPGLGDAGDRYFGV